MVKNKLKLMLLTLLIVYAANSVHAGGNSHNEVMRLSVSKLLLGILMNMMVPNTGNQWQTLLLKYYQEGDLLSFILLLGKNEMQKPTSPEELEIVYNFLSNLGEINYRFTNCLLSDIENCSENGLLRSFSAHIESLDKSLQSEERESFLKGLKCLIWLLDPKKTIEKSDNVTDPDDFAIIILPDYSCVKQVVGWLKFLSTQFEVRSSNLG